MRNHQRHWIYPMAALFFLMILTAACKKEDDTELPPNPVPTNVTVTDIDGNIYHTITIGTQTWMVENLKVTHYRNGDPIQHVSDMDVNLTSGAYTNYDNSGQNGDEYGRLYNWYAVFDGPLLAPEGWHIADKAEWETLMNYLGGTDFAGVKLKETGTEHWQAPNANATNSSGFTALPGGDCFNGFQDINVTAAFWSATEASSNWAYYFLIRNNDQVAVSLVDKTFGLSARCVKD